MSAKISFIIPVYNGEKCILQCIQSIQNWNEKEEIEIIVINDGSKDATGDICEKAAQIDPRIKVLHIENSGQGVARNCGLEIASGTYISFVDADDFIDADKLYMLWEKAESIQADVMMGTYVRIVDGEEEWIHIPKDGYLSRKDEDKELYHKIKTESGFGYSCTKLYRREFLRQHDLWMEDIRKVFMEDQLFNLKVWSKNPVMYCMDIPFYYYVIENNSTSRKQESQIHTKSIAMLRDYITYLKNHRVLEENLDTLVPLLMRMYCWALVKEVPYEGLSFQKMKMRAQAFIEDEEIASIVAKRNAIGYLTYLPSKLQTLFYGFCFLLMGVKAAGLIAVMFWCLYPFMKQYVAKVLR